MMSSARTHRVRVHPLPPWLDAPRLLGAPEFSLVPSADGPPGSLVAEASLSAARAADLGARLRGLCLAGQPMVCEIVPALDRALVRRARTEDARRRRDTTAGFLRRGVKLDEEGRYSLTPEVLALRMGEHAKGRRVVDAGCGAGGNAIGLARAGALVTAIERDPARLELARHNAAVYGVQDRIRFIAGDAEQRIGELAADLWFVDPPWGTHARKRMEVSDAPLLAALLARRPSGVELWAKVPASFAVDTVPGARAEAVFGEARGDAQRIKFLWLRVRA